MEHRKNTVYEYRGQNGDFLRLTVVGNAYGSPTGRVVFEANCVIEPDRFDQIGELRVALAEAMNTLERVAEPALPEEDF